MPKYLRGKTDANRKQFRTMDDVYGQFKDIPSMKGKTKEQIFEIAAQDSADEWEVVDTQDTPNALMDFAVSSIPSTGRLVGDTAKSFWDLTKGAFNLATGDEETRKKVAAVWENRDKILPAVVEGFKQKYGTAEGLDHAMRTDPASVLSDISMFVGVPAAGVRGAATGTKVIANAAKANRVANAAKKVGEVAAKAERVADRIDPALGAVLATERVTRAPRAAVAKWAHGAMLRNPPVSTLTADQIEAAKDLAWTDRIPPSAKSEKRIQQTINETSDLRGAAAQDATQRSISGQASSHIANADVRGTIDLQDPTRRSSPSLVDLWNRLGTRSVDTRRGVFDAVNDFLNRSAQEGKYGLNPDQVPVRDEFGHYFPDLHSGQEALEANRQVGILSFNPKGPYQGAPGLPPSNAPVGPNTAYFPPPAGQSPIGGVFDSPEAAQHFVNQLGISDDYSVSRGLMPPVSSPSVTVPPPTTSPIARNQRRKEANTYNTIMDKHATGGVDNPSKSAAEAEAMYQLQENDRRLLYEEIEAAGVPNPTIMRDGKPVQVSWQEMGIRDRDLMNLKDFIEYTRKKIADEGARGMQPYYLGSALSVAGTALTPDPFRILPIVVTGMFGAGIMARKNPEAAAKILYELAGRNPHPTLWRSVANAYRGSRAFSELMAENPEAATAMSEALDRQMPQTDAPPKATPGPSEF